MSGKMVYEFSRPVTVEDLEPGGEIRRVFEAGVVERQALIERLEIVDLKGLTADMVLRRLKGGQLVKVEGCITADVTQRCVVTGNPIENHVEENVDEIFAPEEYEPPEGIDRDELPEAFDGHDIDIGELATQILSLSLDPYPRVPGANPEWADSGEPTENERRRPFEGLADMLKKQN